MPASRFGDHSSTDPEQRAEVLVEPVLRAGEDSFGWYLKSWQDADRRIAGEPFAELRQRW
jgi:hypothetical protein